MARVAARANAERRAAGFSERAAVERLVKKFSELHGLPPEYIPKIKPDTT